MRLGRFALLSFLGSLPFCLALAMVGLFTGPGWEGAVEIVDQYDLVILFLVMVISTDPYWVSFGERRSWEKLSLPRRTSRLSIALRSLASGGDVIVSASRRTASLLIVRCEP